MKTILHYIPQSCLLSVILQKSNFRKKDLIFSDLI
uniref:Uncharacterized protein n=1 Tax=Rhizophora mucronata TaxID=61149 RepID=A0A2P2PP66_RHIMU